MDKKLISEDVHEPWRRRLTLPAYRVKEAARYADVTTQTIRNWQRVEETAPAAVAHRESGSALSYLQLVEVAFVAVMRRAGISLRDIKNARDYMAKQLGAEYPFAQHRFKTDGQDILMDLTQFDKKAASHLILVNRGGQIAWREILAKKFDQFDYQRGLATRWHVAGKGSPIVIDPRIAFGAPAVKGVATWVLKGRKAAGETVEDIAEDFRLTVPEVTQALRFESASAH